MLDSSPSSFDLEPRPSSVLPVPRPPSSPRAERTRGRWSTREVKAAVLLNGRAKRVDAPTIQAFRALVPEPDLFVSESLEEAAESVRTILRRGYARLMVGGGDGTIAATLNLLARLAREPSMGAARVPELAILRLGTGNALGTLFGSGRALEDAASVLRGEVEGVRTLRVLEAPESGVLFPFGSAGYDAQVLSDYVDLLETRKTGLGGRLMRSIGGYAYALATRTIPRELRRCPIRVRVSSLGRTSILDPETHEEIALDPAAVLFDGVARSVLFGSTPYYGYAMKVLPFALRRSDRFHLRVSTASIPYLMANLPALWRGTLRTPRLVDFLVEDVVIEAGRALPLQLSGDAAGHIDRLRVRLSERTFRVLAV